MVHTWDTSYSGGRDREDGNLKVAQEKSYKEAHLNQQAKCGDCCLSFQLHNEATERKIIAPG
jgi:hypothetical protein